MAGDVGENPVVVVDREKHLCVGSLILRLGNVVFPEDLVFTLTEGRDGQDEPLLVGEVLPNGVDAGRGKALDLEVDGELVDQDLLARRSHALTVDDVVDFQAVELLGLDADEVIATHELAVDVGEHVTVSYEELVVSLLVLDQGVHHVHCGVGVVAKLHLIRKFKIIIP